MKLGVIEEEAILRREEREIGILASHEELTITRARCSPGEQVAGPHVHNGHTDAFYVLEGELAFEIGRERQMIVIPAGGFIAVPAGVAHSLGSRGEHSARWLTIHAPDGGFAAFMRGVRDGVEVSWDISVVPADGGLPASDAIISLDLDH